MTALTIDHDYWKHNEREAIAFLDSLTYEQILDLVELGDTIETIADRIEIKFNSDYAMQTSSTLDLFDALSYSEIQEYLEKRFNFKFEERTYSFLASK